MEAVQQDFKWRLYAYLICSFLVHLAGTGSVCEIKDDAAIPFQVAGKCFEYVNVKMDWDSAVKLCGKHSGVLAKIDRDILTRPVVRELLAYFNLSNIHRILARVGFIANSLNTATWLDGTEVLVPVAPRPNTCGLLLLEIDADYLVRMWEVHDCDRKYPVICQYEDVDLTTDVSVDITTPQTTPEKKAKPRPRVPRKRQSAKKTLTKQSKKSAYMVGQPLSERKCAAVTMCSRFCMTDPRCVCFNYNTVTLHCQLFEGRYNVTYASNPDWSVWSRGQCELQVK